MNSTNFTKYSQYSPVRTKVYQDVAHPNSNHKLFPLGSATKNRQELTQEAPLGYIDETGAYRTNVNNHVKVQHSVRRMEPTGA